MRRLLLLCMVVAGCSGRPDAVRTLTEADEGTAATVRVGQVVAVELHTPATGGVAWDAQPPTGVILSREPGPDYARDPAAAGLARAAGLSSWRYRAGAPGRETLHFELIGGGVAETREFVVEVAE